jgi:hypothetical protein
MTRFTYAEELARRSVFNLLCLQINFMRNLLLLFCSAVFLASCAGSKQNKASAIGLVSLNNYFVKNTVPLPDEYNYKVATSQAAFDETFGMAATMNNSIQKPDFSGQTVVAVIGKASTLQQEIRLDGASVAGKDLHVYYSIKKGSEQSFSATALALVAIPKAIDVKKVNFYQDSVLVKTVPVTIY